MVSRLMKPKKFRYAHLQCTCYNEDILFVEGFRQFADR